MAAENTDVHHVKLSYKVSEGSAANEVDFGQRT